ncbi:MAG: outer membrane protein assembly factor BamA [Pseudomonadota bacterium]
MRNRIGGRVPAALRLGALVLSLLAGFALAPMPVAAQTAVTVTEVVIEGNRRIPAETIVLYAAVEPGSQPTPEDLNLATRNVFATGLFRDVRITPGPGGRLVISVEENPTINRINFEGNDVLNDEALTAVITSRPRRIFTRGSAEADAQLVIEAYRRSGRYGAEVRPVIIEQPDNRVDLVFEIVEGRVTEIEGITFVGNEVFSDRRLRRAIATSEASILSFLFSSDNYDPDRLELDKQLLRRYYLERGYVDFAVLSATAELAVERDGFFVTFAIEEGEPYTYGPAFVTSQALGLDPAEFEPLIDTVEGELYDVREVERTIDAMTFLAGQQGYAFLQVRPRVDKDDEARTISIEYELIEGPRVYVERIDIRGNTSTIDRVIRRQFDLVEGDVFNSRSIARARQRIQGLNYFSRADVRVEEGSADDRAIVVVEVDEKLTGSLAVGVGFSSADGVVGTFVVEERNFLGRGQEVKVEVTLAGERQAVQFSFFEPALLDRDLGAGFDIFYRETDRSDESSFDETNVGFQPRVEFPVSQFGRLELRYRISQDEIRPIIRDPASIQQTSAFINDEAGERLTSSIGYTYVYDLRDDVFQTRSGYLFSIAQDIAGLGGDAQYLRSIASAKAWTNFFDGDVVASAEIEGGAIVSFGDNTTVTERFFLGGDTFRGFAFGGFGPLDSSFFPPGPNGEIRRANDFLGGNYYAVARFQVSFPVGLPEEYGVFAGVFADVGSLWSLDNTTVVQNGTTFTVDDSANLRASVGLSLFWDSTFGPIRINFAYPILTETGDDREFFRFTAGTRF